MSKRNLLRFVEDKVQQLLGKSSSARNKVKVVRAGKRIVGDLNQAHFLEPYIAHLKNARIVKKNGVTTVERGAAAGGSRAGEVTARTGGSFGDAAPRNGAPCPLGQGGRAKPVEHGAQKPGQDYYSTRRPGESAEAYEARMAGKPPQRVSEHPPKPPQPPEKPLPKKPGEHGGERPGEDFYSRQRPGESDANYQSRIAGKPPQRVTRQEPVPSTRAPTRTRPKEPPKTEGESWPHPDGGSWVAVKRKTPVVLGGKVAGYKDVLVWVLR